MGELATVREDTKSMSQNTESALQDITTDLATLKQDTNSTLQDITTDLAMLKQDTNSTLQDLATDLAMLKQDTNSTLQEITTDLATLKLDTNSTLQEIATDLATLKQNTNSTLQEIATDLATLKLDTNSTLRDLQVELTNLRQNTDTVLQVDPQVSIQYLPTSCDEIAQTNPNSPLGYYLIHSETNFYGIHVLCSSPQTPALSCDHIAIHYQYTPSGYYWVRSSNDSAVNVYCDNHLTSQEDPSHSCQYIVKMHPSAPSGYYWVEGSNGSAVNVYCDNHLTSSEDPSHSCQYIAEMNTSTPSGHYWVESYNGSAANVYCYVDSPQHPAPSCQYIVEFSETNSSTPSGYYWVRSSNGSAVNVYCDMARHCCGSTGGWMRVAYLNMTDTSQQCPKGFTLNTRVTEPNRTCEHIKYSGCTSIFYPTRNIQYSKVCGRVRAYQYDQTLAFYLYYHGDGTTIDSNYVSGMSITHGESPRKHIWTFAAAMDETRSQSYVCPCTKTDTPYTGLVPPFIGNDYFCDTGSQYYRRYYWRFYSEDPLWDGEGCGPTSSCCQFNSPPWFCKELPQPTTDDVEVRVCKYDYRRGTPFDLIELYIQ